MPEELNVVNDTQAEVVDPQVDTVPADGEDMDVAAIPQEQHSQSIEENQAFAGMRRQLEASQREQAEAKEKIAEFERSRERLQDILHESYGYSGDLDSIADELLAAQTGQTAEQVRNERMKKLDAERAEAERVRQMQSMENERNYFRNIAVEKLKADLLQEIKGVYPDCSAKSVDEFGEEFANLLVNGVSAPVAYAALNSVAAAKTKPVPPEIGTLNNKDADDMDIFTWDEVNNMTQEEVKKNWDKITRSRIHWNKKN